MKRFKLVLLVAAFALPASITLGVDEAVAEDDMVSREEVQSMIDEAVRKAFRQAVHTKQLIAMMKDRDERLEERFAERDESLEERQSEIYDRLVPAINDVTSDIKEFKEVVGPQAPDMKDLREVTVEAKVELLRDSFCNRSADVDYTIGFYHRDMTAARICENTGVGDYKGDDDSRWPGLGYYRNRAQALRDGRYP